MTTLQGQVEGGRGFPVEVVSSTTKVRVVAVDVRPWEGSGGVPGAEVLLTLDVRPGQGTRYDFHATVLVKTPNGEMRAADGGTYELSDIDSAFDIKSEASFRSYENVEHMRVTIGLDPA